MHPQDWSTITVASLALLGSVVLLVLGVAATWTAVQGVRTHAWRVLATAPVDLVEAFGSWAVVTGATDGIGKAYAHELASRGLNIVLISRTISKLELVADDISRVYGVKTRIIAADFSKGQSVFEHIEQELSGVPVGILVNNVGAQYSYPTYLHEVSPHQLWDIININVGATTMMTRLVVTQMQRRRRGVIVNVSSGAEMQPLPLMTVYAATKMFMKSFSAALRLEYQQDNIKVQHVTPMFVNTKMNAFSSRLQESTLLVPGADTYARHAVDTLCRTDDTTGYWAHGLQAWLACLVPVWLRMHVGCSMNQSFRREYLQAIHDPKSP